MIHQPDGSASLDVRRSYLKRRRGRTGRRGLVAVWVGISLVMVISALGFIGLAH